MFIKRVLHLRTLICSSCTDKTNQNPIFCSQGSSAVTLRIYYSKFSNQLSWKEFLTNCVFVPYSCLFYFHQHRGVLQWKYCHSPPCSFRSQLFQWLGSVCNKNLKRKITLDEILTLTSWRTSEEKLPYGSARPHPLRKEKIQKNLQREIVNLQLPHPIHRSCLPQKEGKQVGRSGGPLVPLLRAFWDFRIIMIISRVSQKNQESEFWYATLTTASYR